MLVNDIFESISGEPGRIPQGAWTAFVRLQECNLQCRWCDTKQAQERNIGFKKSVDEVFERVRHCKYVLITGGEPLLQQEHVIRLTKKLYKNGQVVQIETNGSRMISTTYPPNVSFVFDYKLPSSGMTSQMLPMGAFQKASVFSDIYIKFVYTDENDVNYACTVMKQLKNQKFIFSPVVQNNDLATLITMAKEVVAQNHLSLLRKGVIFSTQLHKLFQMA